MKHTVRQIVSFASIAVRFRPSIHKVECARPVFCFMLFCTCFSGGLRFISVSKKMSYLPLE